MSSFSKGTVIFNSGHRHRQSPPVTYNREPKQSPAPVIQQRVKASNSRSRTLSAPNMEQQRATVFAKQVPPSSQFRVSPTHNYAGPKFSDSPAAVALPKPPSHWLCDSTNTTPTKSQSLQDTSNAIMAMLMGQAQVNRSIPRQEISKRFLDTSGDAIKVAA